MKYDELVKALRCCGNVNTDCTVCPWDKYNFGLCAEKLYTDAAAAIEALEAEVKDAFNNGYNAGYTAGIGYMSFKRENAKMEVQDDKD